MQGCGLRPVRSEWVPGRPSASRAINSLAGIIKRSDRDAPILRQMANRLNIPS